MNAIKQSEMNNCPRCGSDQTTLLEEQLLTSATWVNGVLSVGVNRYLRRCANCNTDYQQVVNLSNNEPRLVEYQYTYSEWVADEREDYYFNGHLMKGGSMKEFTVGFESVIEG